jgi:hypothetical protein
MSKNNDITVIKKKNIYYAGYNMVNNNLDWCNYNDNWLEKNSLNNYIIENNLENELDYVDPENGNTIFHDVLSSTNNHAFIEKVIKTFDIDYTLKNNNNKTPIECVEDIKITVCIINDLNNRLYSMNKRLDNLESKNNINEISILSFLKVKFIIFLNNNLYLLSIIVLSIIIYNLL